MSAERLYHNWNGEWLGQHGLVADLREIYFSISVQNTLRGLHFQLPPFEHTKCGMSLKGRIFAGVVDLRTDSPTYLRTYTTVLEADRGNMLYVPAGLAHGILTLTPEAIFLNRTSQVYMPSHDVGVRWDTCGIAWPCRRPVLSAKDANLPALPDLPSPFRFDAYQSHCTEVLLQQK